MTNELTHHGILGMKWGVRRFQNKDGSLTAAGKKRKLITMRESVNKANAAAKDARNKVISEAKASGESKKLGSFRRVNNRANAAASEARKESIRNDKEYNKSLRAERKAAKEASIHEDYKKAHNSKSVKNMSDAELRSRLNRLNMEKQYSQLSDTNVNKGKQYFDTTFKVATTVAAVTTTGLTIYNNADKIKKIVEPMIKK